MNRFFSTFTSPLFRLSVLFACSLSLPASLQAASFTASGYNNNFATQPPAADWSQFSIAGAAADNGSVALLDTSVNTVAAASITAQTLPIAMDPPDLNGAATWSSTGFYLQTRPTGNGATLLMLTLVNNSGSDPGVIRIAYDFLNPVPTGEGLEGHRGYYSRTGATGSWIPIPALAFPAPGRVTADVDVSWPVGSKLYLLWADDNGAPSPDTTSQIDNFSVTKGVLVPVAITTQPVSQTVVAGASATFTVAASGSGPTYQWQRETPPGSGIFANIAGATATNYVLNPAQVVNSGLYRVVVSNTLNSVTSSVVTLSVLVDRFGPRMLTAIVSETISNQIRLVWDERLSGATASVLANYALTPIGSTNRVPIQFLTYNPGPPSQTTITIATNSGGAITNNWYPGGNTNYVLTVNNIRDVSTSNNVVAPNSQIAISWPLLTNIFNANQVWIYHNIWAFDTGIYTDSPLWYATNFTPSEIWGAGAGPFYKDLFLENSCLGAFQTEIGYQRQPTLFRTWFNWPAANTSNAILRLQYSIDDGAVFYLNGVEILGSRVNMPTGPVNSDSTRSLADIGDPGCATNSYTVTNLRPGTSNLLAVAIYQSTDNNQSDIVFGMRLDAVSFRTATLPAQAIPSLVFAKVGTNGHRLSWVGNSYALESTTIPSATKTNSPTPKSFYSGPWYEVQPNMSNPYTNSGPTDPFRIYRLRKVNHGSP